MIDTPEPASDGKPISPETQSADCAKPVRSVPGPYRNVCRRRPYPRSTLEPAGQSSEIGLRQRPPLRTAAPPATIALDLADRGHVARGGRIYVPAIRHAMRDLRPPSAAMSSSTTKPPKPRRPESPIFRA